jgi:hypothetical protein
LRFFKANRRRRSCFRPDFRAGRLQGSAILSGRSRRSSSIPWG